MGLLDDAIREHLELKRLHGATDDEIAQKEAEALGPARRDFPRAVAESEHDEVPEEAAEADIDALEPAEPAADLESIDIAEPPVFEPRHEPLEPSPAEAPDTEEYRLEEDEGPDEEGPVRHEGDPFLEELEDEPERDRGEPPEKSEDLLEDTPEFLQDAPEHDRLWFEQKPPRDFDFE
jgi:hypothetical protein